MAEYIDNATEDRKQQFREQMKKQIDEKVLKELMGEENET